MVSYKRREVMLVKAIKSDQKEKHLQIIRAFSINIWILFKNVVYDFHVFLFNC